MIQHHESRFTIYFGDAKDSLPASQISNDTKVVQTFGALKNVLNVQGLLFLRQTHGTDAKIISSQADLYSQLDLFREQGDIILSKVPNIGIGVLTADCLPIAIYDELKQIISVVHAGWRGTVSQVLQQAISLMRTQGAKINDLRFYFGPSAKQCCYEVQPDFIDNLRQASNFTDQVISRRGSFFLDLPLLNKLQLLQTGIKEYQIDETSNECTICNSKFYSWRRDGTLAGRQATVAVLHDNI